MQIVGIYGLKYTSNMTFMIDIANLEDRFHYAVKGENNEIRISYFSLALKEGF